MMRQALATFCSSWARCSNESFRRVLWAKAAIRNLLSDGLSQQLPISQKAGWSPLCFLQPAPAVTCRIITALLHSGKALLSGLSAWAQATYGVSLSAARLAGSALPQDLPEEVVEVLTAIERGEAF